MNIITIKPKDGERYEIGYQGDHNVNKIVFDVESEGDLYLKLQLNEKEYEPIPIPNKEFPITSTYTQEQCTYCAQILEKDELGDYRKNSPVFKLSLKKSIEETDNVKEVVPPNFKNAYDDMVDITNQIKEAFENGDFNGNGIVSIEKESTNGLIDTYKIIFSDRKETRFNVTNGKGIVSIKKTNTQENVDTYTITYNDETISTFTVTNGIDGYSPQVSVQQEVDGVTISVTDNVGTTKAKVLNGTNGKDGTDGKDGIDGTTPNIQIGTVTTLEPDQQATVERTGDDENPVFNFGIPRGKDGEVKDPLQFAIKETTQGNPTIISDSADWRLQKLNVYGQSGQDSTTGKNLLNPTGATKEGWNIELPNFRLEVGKQYTYTAPILEGSKACGLYIKATDTQLAPYLKSRKTQTFTVPEEADFSQGILLAGDSEDALTLGDELTAMVELGSVATEFEPYTGGKPSPSPDYPQEILSKEVKEVKFIGRNILNPQRGSVQNIPLKKGTVLTILTKDNIPSLGGNVQGQTAKGEYVWIAIDAGKTKSVVKLKNDIVSFKNVLIEGVEHGLFIGDTDIYEPYKEQVVNLTSPITLRGIPVDNGGNVTIDGQQYVSDVICEKDGIIGVDRNVIDLSPSDGIVFKQTLDKPNRALVSKPFKTSILPKNAEQKSLSTHFVWGPWAIGYNNKEWLFSVSARSLYISPPAKEVDYTKEEIESLVNGEWAKIKNEAKFYAQLSEPTFEPLPETDQEAIRKLKTFYPNTVIQTGCWNEVEYVADTKLYIEKKLSEISSQLTELKADTLLLGGM